MNKILKYQEYDSCAKIWEDFAKLLVNANLNESKDDNKVTESEIIKITKQLSKDLKFNLKMVLTFGTGISAMYPIVEHLIKKSSLTGLTLTKETIVLLTITAISIAYLEINKNKPGATEIICSVCDGLGKITRKGVQNLEEVDEKENCHNCHGEGKTNSVVTKKDAQTLLFECRQRGAGKGIITKLANCLISIGDFVGKFVKTTIVGANYAISSLIDLFGYTAILEPSMNAISSLIDENSWTLDNLPQIIGNLLSLGVGALSFLIKRGWDHLASRLSNFFKKVPKNQGDIVDTTWNPDNLENQDIIKERGK
jgi:hypothetical protein